MAETKLKNFWDVLWAILIAAAVFAGYNALHPLPELSWKRVPLDGHLTGAEPLTAESSSVALGVFTDSAYLAPSGAAFPSDGPVALVARALMDAQPSLAHLKVVVAHSAGTYLNLRDQADLPLGNLVADVLRSYGSAYFKVPMDFAIVNYGGIRCPLPEGSVTLDDISCMFPFKNCLCYCKVPGSGLQALLEQLSGMEAFQAVSGCQVRVKGGKLESALVGGAPIDPGRTYNVATIDFLLDGGDKLNIGALSSDLTLTHVLVKDVMLSYLREMEASGKVVSAQSDGRVVMED